MTFAGEPPVWSAALNADRLPVPGHYRGRSVTLRRIETMSKTTTIRCDIEGCENEAYNFEKTNMQIIIRTAPNNISTKYTREFLNEKLDLCDHCFYKIISSGTYITADMTTRDRGYKIGGLK